VITNPRPLGYTLGRVPGSSRRGRRALVVIFCALRLNDLLIYFGSPVNDRSPLLAAILTAALWTTILLAGVWFRQNWCRPALSFVLFVITCAVMMLFRDALDMPVSHGLFVVVAISALINVAAAWAMVCLPDIRRLTSRASGSHPFGYG